jgi:hypothetical protein
MLTRDSALFFNLIVVRYARFWFSNRVAIVSPILAQSQEMGISKKEIVIGFHHPSMCKYSEYAVS